jgi:hypothetical protein
MGALFVAACGYAQAADQSNTTGLPTYPNMKNQRMDAVYRSLPNGQNCIHFSAVTPDDLTAVEDWYKKALPNAKIDDVNKNSLYGNYFKLDGIKLLNGNDIANIYRMKNDKQTSVELFKCRAAPAKASS